MLNFINQYGLGDCHVSRSLVADLAQKLGQPVTYWHPHPDYIFKDMDWVQKSISELPDVVKSAYGIGRPYNDLWIRSAMNEFYGQIYMNTWYEASISIGFEYKISNFDALYALFKYYYDYFKVDFPEEWDALPKIDYSRLEKEKVIECISHKFPKNILVCNEEPKSGQSEPFDFRVINWFAETFPDVGFWMTNDSEIKFDKPNIFNIDDSLPQPNILEISYLSTFCDLIFSRCSGVSTCTLNYENIMSDNIKYICYTKYMNLPYFYKNQKNVISVLDERSAISALYSCVRNL